MNEESNSHVRNFKHRKYINEAEPRCNLIQIQSNVDLASQVGPQHFCSFGWSNPLQYHIYAISEKVDFRTVLAKYQYLRLKNILHHVYYNINCCIRNPKIWATKTTQTHTFSIHICLHIISWNISRLSCSYPK
jgi:hypothetical protein